MGESLSDVDALIFSHAHYDHTGGLSTVLSQKPGLSIYAHSDLFRWRYSIDEDRPSIGLHLTEWELGQEADMHLADELVGRTPSRRCATRTAHSGFT